MEDNFLEPANLFWTGGWDSTFRLLQLVIDEKRVVQTYYLIDANRKSTINEIATILKIKKKLVIDYPHTIKLLLPTQFHEISSIKPNIDISNSYKDISNRIHLGSQYDWLARFCDERNIHGMELSLIKGGITYNLISSSILVESRKNSHYSDLENDTIYRLFHYFSFPTLNLSKLDIKKISEEKNWMKIMDMTWFCHKPRAGHIPCGKCRPCRIVIEQGMEYRIPIRVRLANRFRLDIAEDWLHRKTKSFRKRLHSLFFKGKM